MYRTGTYMCVSLCIYLAQNDVNVYVLADFSFQPSFKHVTQNYLNPDPIQSFHYKELLCVKCMSCIVLALLSIFNLCHILTFVDHVGTRCIFNLCFCMSCLDISVISLFSLNDSNLFSGQRSRFKLRVLSDN